MRPRGPIRVLIADDEPLIRKALALTIATDTRLELVACASDADEAIELAGSACPDVALLDVRMPAGGGLRATEQIRARCPDTRIVAFSAYSDSSVALDMVRAGAVAYMVKGTGADDLLDAIRRIARGESVMSAEVAGSVLGELSAQLAQRQRENTERQDLHSRIRNTIDEEEFKVVFQPIVQLRSGRVGGLEALSRFPGQPPHGPVEWFEDAARVGLRGALELATARTAAAQLEQLPDGAYLAINFSPDTLPLCLELVSKHPRRIVIEITEHAAIDDYASVIGMLDTLRALGVRVAVGDAGAGFASLRHALQLSPDVLKLDVSLTHGIDSDSRRRALAVGLIAFARELGADVVAEGIETRGELVTLRALGVSLGQGHYLAAPAPLPAPAIPLDRFS